MRSTEMLRPPTAPLRRIAHVVCSDRFAGVERYVQEGAIEASRQGHDVTVIGGPLRMGMNLAASGVRWLPGTTPLAAGFNLLRGGSYDAIITHMTKADLIGLIAGRVCRSPVISVRHFAAPRRRTKWALIALQLLSIRFETQIAISRFVQKSIDGPSCVILSGVNNSDVKALENRNLIVLVLQRLEAEKATEVAIKAWAVAGLRAPWRMVVVGEGSQRGALMALASKLEVAQTVEFVGFQDNPEEWMQKASIFVAPAPAEPFGLSVVEAMSFGLAVVAARGGAHPETVGRVRDAALFSPGDVESAAEWICRLADDREMRIAYGQQLRMLQQESFAISNQVSRTLEIIPMPASEH